MADFARANAQLNAERLSLLGHSLGGMLAALSAQALGAERALLLAPALPEYFEQYFEQYFEEFTDKYADRDKGAIQDAGGWPLSRAYVEGLLAAKPLEAARAFAGAAAVIHGTADVDCPAAWAGAYAEAFGGAEVALLKGANHTFDQLGAMGEVQRLSGLFLRGEGWVLDWRRWREMSPYNASKN